MLYLKNGYLIDPASGTEGYRDILIGNGKIIRIVPQGEPMEAQEPVQVIDLNGRHIVPGLVDVHVHFRDPGFTYK
ncbi:MAG: dihydroorotase, partial [Lachnospiraceae bacterium]|nr:dihydroorotase [Lachnospiraceae bacterium]